MKGDIKMDSNSTGTPERQTQISCWMGRIETELARADEVKQRVIGKMASLTREPEPSPVAEEDNVAESLVPLAGELCKFVFKISHISEQYEEMLSLLEI